MDQLIAGAVIMMVGVVVGFMFSMAASGVKDSDDKN